MTMEPPARIDQQDQQLPQPIPWFGMVTAGSTVFVTLALTAPFVFSRSSLPYMATPGIKVQRALQYIQHHQQKQQQQGGKMTTSRKMLRFVDLGSGDGEAVYQAVKAGYREAIGIEMNFTLYAISNCRRIFGWSRDEQSRSSFYLQDLFRYNCQQADTIMIFGVNPLMERISKKLAQECVPGTHILCYRFLLPTMPTNNISSIGLLQASIVYEHEEITIYRID